MAEKLDQDEMVSFRELLIANSIQIDAMAKSANAQIQAERIAAENQREGARLGVKLATDLDKSQREDQKEGAKLGIEIARELTRGNE